MYTPHFWKAFYNAPPLFSLWHSTLHVYFFSLHAVSCQIPALAIQHLLEICSLTSCYRQHVVSGWQYQQRGYQSIIPWVWRRVTRNSWALNGYECTCRQSTHSNQPLILCYWQLTYATCTWQPTQWHRLNTLHLLDPAPPLFCCLLWFAILVCHVSCHWRNLLAGATVEVQLVATQSFTSIAYKFAMEKCLQLSITLCMLECRAIQLQLSLERFGHLAWKYMYTSITEPLI